MHEPRGEWAIELTRTRGWRARDRSDDELQDWTDCVRWAKRTGVIEAGMARNVAMAGNRRPAAARRALGRVRRFREAMYRVLVSRAAGIAAERSDLRRLNTELRAMAPWRVLSVRRGCYTWGWAGGAVLELDFIVWQIALSVTTLLTGESAERIRLCSSHDCGWLFLDESRNGSRRWCSMEGCGNVEKARRYRRRQRPG